MLYVLVQACTALSKTNGTRGHMSASETWYLVLFLQRVVVRTMARPTATDRSPPLSTWRLWKTTGSFVLYGIQYTSIVCVVHALGGEQRGVGIRMSCALFGSSRDGIQTSQQQRRQPILYKPALDSTVPVQQCTMTLGIPCSDTACTVLRCVMQL
jgi:hypothetical protein